MVIVGKGKMRADGIPSPDRLEEDMLAYAPDLPQAPHRQSVSRRVYSG